ncbi:NAD(P)-dependent oxidoreductase [Candidatus Kirkpatrickella diaphorinae]|uniref:NAD(P)-dependent oxidoreductase n=1 Tax=Candidatus Kirkpatrickella diaphorinae TaxID=2984322 RepID=A0ABY6GL38_9PROT|nr:NAD(P)-dependent oxidoreductase [Candidatus Kirkpatrickella diaphorinae]UYH52170.1 NAD(P)-dependent oxidoreductase [Candidatus Kirkpatrickella diaphorinae]
MVERMLQFVSVPQEMPQKRDADARRRDFAEIYKNFALKQAERQASRCSQCGVPFCSVHCPLGNNIPDWLMLTAEGRLEEAYAVSSATNSFPEICGRVCPQDRLCEGNCVIQKGFESVTIGAVEKFVTENAFAEGWVKPRLPRVELAQSVAIIGAGPAGLAAAERLRARGYQVHVYDRHDRIGGLLVYGIPSFKLEKDIIARRHDLLVRQGIQFHLKTEIGEGEGRISFAALRDQHDAVFIATGVYQSRDIALPGAARAGVIQALAYLTESNKRGYHDVPDTETTLHARDRRVVVIGGGDTAMDCVRTAIRQGAASVTCLYRRDRVNMPGSAQEVRNAEEEGVTFSWLTTPVEFIGAQQIEAIKVQAMRLGGIGPTGRRDVEPVPGDVQQIQADLVILALGFEPEDLRADWRVPELGVTHWGTVQTRPGQYETNLEGIFAGGDIVRGASLVVWAIRDGQEAAESMHAYLKARDAAESHAAAAMMKKRRVGE